MHPAAGIVYGVLARIVVCDVARPSQDPAPAALSVKANDPAAIARYCRRRLPRGERIEPVRWICPIHSINGSDKALGISFRSG